MKKAVKLFSIALTLALVAGTMPACGRSNNKKQVDETKLQLEVGGYEGALGTMVAQSVIDRFEEKYKDVQFGDKIGVQVQPMENGNYLGSRLVGATASYDVDVYLTEECYYYDLMKNDMLDISDVVKSSFQYDFVRKTTDETAESGTFRDKMFDTDINYLNVGEGEEEQYFAVPTRQSFYGIWYNVNMFDQNDWYFSDNETLEIGSFGVKSLGSDNLPNTYDDGLPATYEQFYALCKKISVQNERSAIVYPGSHMNYTTSYLTALWADYAGKDELMTGYDFEGTAYDIVTGFDAQGNPIVNTDGEVITPSNGYLPHEDSAGKYYALEFAYNLCKPSNVGGSADFLYRNTNLTQYASQRAFVVNAYDKAQDCAMIMDGSWWTYEARAEIQHVQNTSLLPGEELKYGFMPFPKAHADQIGEKQTIIDYNYSLMFIPKSIEKEKIDVAKAFVQFWATEQSLQEYVKQYGSLPEYKMTVDKNGEFYNGLSYFTRNLIDVRENCDIVVPVSNNSTYRKIGSQINAKNSAWSGQTPFTTFLDSAKKDTAKTLFEKLNYKNYFTNL